MKIYLTIISILFTHLVVNAQTVEVESDAMVNVFSMEKKEAVMKLVPVSGKDSVTFWTIYEEFQKSNKVTAVSRMNLFQKTVNAYSDMTPSVADSLAKQYFINRIENEKNLQVYYNKIKLATNAIIAFEFYQAEVYLLTQIRASIMAQIPTYGEMHAYLKNNK